MINQQKISEVFVIMFSNYSRFVCNGYFHSYSELDKNPLSYFKKNKIKISEDIASLLDSRADFINLYISKCDEIINGKTEEKTIEKWNFFRNEIIKTENLIKEEYPDFIKDNSLFNITPEEPGTVPDGYESQITYCCKFCGTEQTTEERNRWLKEISEHTKELGYIDACEKYEKKCYHCGKNHAISECNKHMLKSKILKEEIELLLKEENPNEELIIEKYQERVCVLQMVDPFFEDIYYDSLSESGDCCLGICEIDLKNNIRNQSVLKIAKMGVDLYKKAIEHKANINSQNLIALFRIYFDIVCDYEEVYKKITPEKMNLIITDAEYHYDLLVKLYAQTKLESNEFATAEKNISMMLCNACVVANKCSYPESEMKKLVSLTRKMIDTTRYLSTSDYNYIDLKLREVCKDEKKEKTNPNTSSGGQVFVSRGSSNHNNDHRPVFSDPDKKHSNYEDIGTVFKDSEKDTNYQENPMASNIARILIIAIICLFIFVFFFACAHYS